jgi:hypothetical protein
MKKSLLVFFSVLVCLLSGIVNAEQATPCSKSKQALPFQAYGLQTPKGWSCDISVFSNRLIYWTKGDESAKFFEENLKDVLSSKNKKSIAELEQREPLRSIRMFIEGFLGDQNALAQNAFWEKSAKQFLPKTKGILFSKNNEYIVVYGNSGAQEMLVRSTMKEEPALQQTVIIFKKGQHYKHLNIETVGMTPDEVFSLLINPVIQK